jgi:nucleotide-binding universal stress UspA family protein/voltage-gated potassium channel Kch
LRGHVIVAGFGRFGNYLAHKLTKAGVPYQVLEINPERVARARALDYPVFYGDASRIEVLRSAGAANASMVVFAMDQMESVGQAVVTAREAFPDLPVYARAWDIRMARKLLSLGVTYAIPETMATGLQLTRDVLHASGVSAELTEQLIVEGHDGEYYKITKSPTSNKQSGYRDILLVLTPDIDEVALLNYATALAKDNRSALTVVEVLSEASTGVEHGVSFPDELEEQMTENRRRRLEVLVDQLDTGLDIQTRVLVGSPHEEITREVVSNGRDLVVKIAEGGRELRERLFGDNDSRLLKSCPCPVLLVRSIPPKPFRHRCICAGVYQDEHPGGHQGDRNAINHRILEHASWLATSQFAELHIVHVWEAYGEQHLRDGRSPYHFDADNYVESEQKRNNKALNTCLSELRESMPGDALASFNPVCHLVKGSHRDEIIKFAKNIQADLVVVGDLVPSGITGLIVDSTAATIARNLDCSVLVVKPAEFVTPVIVEEL